MESACVNAGCVETCVKIEAAICVRDIPQDQPNNVLFFRGVPLDCSKREAAHIFRHFNGFKAMRFVKRKKKEILQQTLIIFVSWSLLIKILRELQWILYSAISLMKMTAQYFCKCFLYSRVYNITEQESIGEI